jgi:hypothetical protein
MSTPATPFHKRPLWIAIAAFLALVLVAGGIAAATGAFSGGGTPAAAPTSDATAAEPETPTSPSTPALPDGAASVCGLPGYEETSSLTQAPTVTWSLIGTMAAPVDPQGSGPGAQENDGQFRTCFAHTAQGALFAAINFAAAGSNPSNHPRMYELLADGKAKDMVQAAGSGTDQTSSDRVQVAAFKVNAYAPDTATIDLVLKVTSAGDALVSQPLVLNWEHGDWKVLLTENGTQYQPSPLTSLGGYIPFAGV